MIFYKNNSKLVFDYDEGILYCDKNIIKIC